MRHEPRIRRIHRQLTRFRLTLHNLSFWIKLLTQNLFEENLDTEITAISSGKREPGPYNARWNTEGAQQLRQIHQSRCNYYTNYPFLCWSLPQPKNYNPSLRPYPTTPYFLGKMQAQKADRSTQRKLKCPQSLRALYTSILGRIGGHPSPETQRLSTMKSAEHPPPGTAEEAGHVTQPLPE